MMAILRRLDLTALALGLCAAGVGAAGMIGYVAGLPGLLRPAAQSAPIAFSAAVMLTLGGLAVAVAALPPFPPARRLTGVAGGLIAALALEAIAARLLGFDLALDLATLAAVPGRPAGVEHIAPTASLCFAVLGAGLAALPFVRGRRSAFALTAVA